MLLYFGFFFASVVYGLVTIGIVRWVNFAFIYKYLLAFSTFALIRLILRDMDQVHLKRLIVLMTIVYLFLVFNMFLDVFCPVKYLNNISYKARAAGRLSYIRPALPFTSARLPDGHLYAAYLTNMMVLLTSWFVFKLKVVNPWITLLSFPACATAVILTGSRANMLVMFLFSALLFFIFVKRGVVNRKFQLSMRRKRLVFLAIILVLVISAGAAEKLASNKDASFLISRTFYLTGLADQRLPKIMKAVRLVVLEGPVIIGIGMPSTNFIWLDNAAAAILLASGLGGLLVFAGVILVYLHNVYRQAVENQRMAEFWCLFLVVGHYVTINLVSTEFFLGTRSVVPFAISCGILTSMIHQHRNTEVKPSGNSQPQEVAV